MKKYTYKEWWEGKVVLIHSTFQYAKEKPIITTWENFNEKEKSKIKEQQKQLFEKRVKELFQQFTDTFSESYSKSKMKERLLKNEIEQCKTIMFAPIPNYDLLKLKHWGFLFEYQDLADIQHYIKETLERGLDFGYDFIHSPNCEYQIKGKTPAQIYAQSIWEYHQWLVLFSANLNNERKSGNIQESEKVEIRPKVDKIENNIPENPHPEIFINADAYNLFLELQYLIVKDETIIADFAFIFHTMKKDQFIFSDIKHKTFINLLNNKFNANIFVDKFPYKNQIVYLNIYNKILSKYKSLTKK